MKSGFVLPSCNYNIELSKDDIRQLLEKGYITRTVSKMEGTFKDELGVTHNVLGHCLAYRDDCGEYPVQFIGLINKEVLVCWMILKIN